MRINIIILSTLFQFLNAYSQSFNQKYGIPIVELHEADLDYEAGSYSEIGLDVPTFVLYENGQILFRKIIDKKVRLFEAQIEKGEINGFIKEIGITNRLIRHLPKTILTTEASCQGFTALTLRLDSIRRLYIYGDISRNESGNRRKVPKYILSIYDNLIKYNNEQAKEWIPEYFEAILVDSYHSTEIPLNWPEGWPDLNSLNATAGNMGYYILLQYKYFCDYYKLISDLKKKQAIIINGREFTPSFKFCFPNLK